MLERDADGRLKRIEYRGKYLRASRTGGVALRTQTKAAGVNLTANSSRGMRVSTRIAKGTQVALQNGRFVLRGRYGKGPLKLNLSKSGPSVSSRTSVGTFNLFKPRYSSAKIGGIQVRGKNAVYIHMVVALLQLIVHLFLFLVQLAVILFQGACWLIARLWVLLRRSAVIIPKRRVSAAEATWLAELEDREPGLLRECLEFVFLHLAQGVPLTTGAADPSGDDPIRLVVELLAQHRLKPPLNLEVLFGCLAEAYAARVGDDAALEFFFSLDKAAVETGGRNLLQERLLSVYVDACGIEDADA